MLGLALVPANLFYPDHQVSLSPWVTTVTHAFLHADAMHLLGNMLLFWIFADNIEYAFGRIRFVIFLAAGAFFASIFHALTDMSSAIPLVGASGAGSAILGAYFRLYPKAIITVISPFFALHMTMEIRAYWFLVMGVILDIAGIFQDADAEVEPIAFVAHIAGFLFGWATAKLLRKNFCSYDYIHG